MEDLGRSFSILYVEINKIEGIGLFILSFPYERAGLSGGTTIVEAKKPEQALEIAGWKCCYFSCEVMS
jgi:hypothetical protein